MLNKLTLISLALAGAGVLASNVDTELRYASFDSITVTKPFLVQANRGGRWFQDGEPVQNPNGADACYLGVKDSSPHDRQIGEAGKPETVPARLHVLTENDQPVPANVAELTARFDVDGATLSSIVCYGPGGNPPTVGDFQRHFGNYVRLDLTAGPDHVHPLQ